jgi:hypothetical protein
VPRHDAPNKETDTQGRRHHAHHQPVKTFARLHPSCRPLVVMEEVHPTTSATPPPRETRRTLEHHHGAATCTRQSPSPPPWRHQNDNHDERRRGSHQPAIARHPLPMGEQTAKPPPPSPASRVNKQQTGRRRDVEAPPPATCTGRASAEGTGRPPSLLTCTRRDAANPHQLEPPPPPSSGLHPPTKRSSPSM